MSDRFDGNISLVDLLFPARSRLGSETKAVLTILGIVVVTTILIAISIFTSYVYLPQLALGVFWGVVASYPIMHFFGPKVQSLVTGFLGGVTLSNIGGEGAKLARWIAALSQWIDGRVATLDLSKHSGNAHLNEALVYNIWTAIVVALSVMAANAFFQSKDEIRIGTEMRSDPKLTVRSSGPIVPRKREGTVRG